MKLPQLVFGLVLIPIFVGLQGSGVGASSHMDAPLITLDPTANTTDVYAFVSESNGKQYLTTALAVDPFEEPGIGPNNYSFDDDVLYEIHLSLGPDLPQGAKTLSYQFRFKSEYLNDQTILQAFLGPVTTVFDSNQNFRQTYTVTKVNHLTRTETDLGEGQELRVPPNNQGRLTPLYNAISPNPERGDNPAVSGATIREELDEYTKATAHQLPNDYQVFAGQREDGFYADIQSIFDRDFLFGGPNKPFDSQQGFNVHTIVLDIPLTELGGYSQAGVFATTSRQQRSSLSRRPENRENQLRGPFIQIARQGNPLFNEGFVAINKKDLYNQTDPTRDASLFQQYAVDPELASLIGLSTTIDFSDIYIPDVIKVDLTTGPARLPGNSGFSRLGLLGGDTLSSSIGGTVSGGWPNGRRFGDDVIDIALAILAMRGGISLPTPINIDKVLANDQLYHQTFPYAGTPHNGRAHNHH